MKRNKNIYCLEGLWNDYDLKDKSSVIPLLEFLAKSRACDFIYHDCATKDELAFFLKKWAIKSISYKFPILYLACHGEQEKIFLNRHDFLTGGNWQPGESVHVVVNDDGLNPEQPWQRDVTVTADEQGAILDSFDLPNWFVAAYTVDATGSSGRSRPSSVAHAIAFNAASFRLSAASHIQKRVPRSPSPESFLTRTNAIAAIGYQVDVDWMKSSACDLLVFEALQADKLDSRGIQKIKNKIFKDYGNLPKQLNLRMVINEKVHFPRTREKVTMATATKKPKMRGC